MLEKELTPEFLAQDIVNLGMREVYIKLMIDGLASRAFSARTMDTPSPLPVNNRQKVIEWSREHYAAKRDEVEKAIAEWHAPLMEERPMASRPAERGPSRVAYPPPRQEPVRQPSRDTFSRPAPRPRAEMTRPVPLSEALKQDPVDFRGRKFSPKPAPVKPKVEVDVEGLRKVLEESGAKKE